MEIIPLTEATEITETFLYKTLNLRKWKDSLPETHGYSPGIITERSMCAQAFGGFHRDRVVPQREEGMPIPSVENIFSYMDNNSSVLSHINQKNPVDISLTIGSSIS